MKTAMKLAGAFFICVFFPLKDVYAESSTGLGYSLPFPLLITSAPCATSVASTDSTDNSKKSGSEYEYDEDDVVYDKSVECRNETVNGETKIVCKASCFEALASDRDKNETFSTCVYACEKNNDGAACNKVAYLYSVNGYYATGGLPNESKEREYYEKGCALNYGEACHQVAYKFLRRFNSPKEEMYYDKACKLNFSEACFKLAEKFVRTDAAEQDRKKARFYYDKACGIYETYKAEGRLEKYPELKNGNYFKCERMNKVVKEWDAKGSAKGKSRSKKK